MAVRLEELKTIREKERKEEVNSKMMQRWKESADELRTQDSQLTAMRCKIEQEHQMWEKEQREKQLREENAIYDELWMREKIKKDQKELEELEKKEELNRQRLAYLNQQLAMREQNRKNQSQKDRDEKKMLNDEWEKEKQNEIALQRERERFMRDRNLEIIQHNELTKQIKKDEELREKELDKMLIAQIVQKERDQLEFEAQERRRHREEAKELQSHYKLRGQEDAELDRRIEEYANMESQQQWEEQERIWREREEARIKLLEEVYNNRADAIYERKRKEEEENQREIEEKERIAREVAKAEEIEQMRKTALRMTKVNHQDNLKWQIDEKNERKKKELQEEMYEQRAAKLAEIQYKKMIEEEKKRGMQLLDELRAKRPF
ncbi:unnamed protein product [Blepharisma stoltei]|uniref:Cilia- and flagella-associated protein 53 n=1 Tax=Blepharisma stoltei TaxID=1481888 RepID=A0AAU9K490_9CILI|nr:unnamed protein product [Blepharisma stoltei]